VVFHCTYFPFVDSRSAPIREAENIKSLLKNSSVGKSALEGERKQATVLLADMKGSMELLADRDHEEARLFIFWQPPRH